MSERDTRILIVANRTAAAPQLLDEVRRRVEAGRCRFALLIPDVRARGAADWTLEIALPLLRRAAKSEVEGLLGGPEPLESVKQALAEGSFDEVIVSTLPRRFSRWIKRDLITQVKGLGLPVTVITPGGGMTNRDAARVLARIGPGAGLGG